MTDVEPAQILPSDELSQKLWQILNAVPVPLWLAMIVAPESAVTRKIMDRSGVVFAGFSVAYVLQLARSATEGGPGKMDLDSMRASLSTPGGFLTGWTHFLAFDLFVGRWIWERSLAEGRSSRVALAMTFMLGPAGLGVFGAQRRSLSPEHRPA